jgi:hypothetical protein
MDEANHHKHGRWTGLFKLAEECGELVVALADLALCDAGDAAPDLRTRVADELADVGASAEHVTQANGLDRPRIADRLTRQIANLDQYAVAAACPGRAELLKRLGAVQQLIGKICAFPDSDEHPDACGNLTGRLEAAIADLGAACRWFARANLLERDAIDARAQRKLQLFRQWMTI